MSVNGLYQWTGQIEAIFSGFGAWQARGLALYSYGVMKSQENAPGKVAEQLGEVGKPESVERRLERWVANRRLVWAEGCREWTGWVMAHWEGEQVILLVDETKLGNRLSAMVVGLAYRGCCIPLAWWCYPPKAWPMGQVALIDTLLDWIAPHLPVGMTPLVQADRGIGTSPDLIRAVERRGWHYLFRVQNQTHVVSETQPECALRDLLTQAGTHTTTTGQVFKKAGWLTATIHILWGNAYREPWCLVTNAPDIDAWSYAKRYWQEASFRDLKSDGWQWQTSRMFTPAHANLLLLVLTVAYACVLSFGSLVFDDPAVRRLVSYRKRAAFSIFRLGLRLLSFLHETALIPTFVWSFLDAPPPRPKTVGA